MTYSPRNMDNLLAERAVCPCCHRQVCPECGFCFDTLYTVPDRYKTVLNSGNNQVCQYCLSMYADWRKSKRKERARIKAGHLKAKSNHKNSTNGYVYIAIHPDGYKIGASTNLARRLYNLGKKYQLVHAIETHRHLDLERRIHQLLQGRRVRREIFSLRKRDLVWLKRLKTFDGESLRHVSDVELARGRAAQ